MAEAIIFIGLQASGKSSFYKEKFFDSHVRINLDMLNTRNREKILLDACLEAKQSFVIDNTNPTAEDRAKYISKAKEQGFKVIGFYFQSKLEECKSRNAARTDKDMIPLPGILGTYNKLELPSYKEGFDELFYVKTAPGNSFTIEDWSDEI